MMPGFVEVEIATFYADILPQIKNGVEIIESSWDGAKKSDRSIIIKWGYKDDTKEKIILAISQLNAAGDKYWVVPSLIQRI